jgi:hypothetical protein
MSGIVLHRHFDSVLFLVSVISMTLGGASKVAWKLNVVTRGKDAKALTKAFRILMFGGFGLMIVSVLLKAGQGVFGRLSSGFTSMPSLIFFIIGIAGMCMMGYLGAHMDKSARSNWIEEIVNTLAQASILIGLLALKK